MVGLILLVLIAILAASSSFVSAAGKVADGRKRGLRTLTKKGRITIALNIAVIAASAIQYYLNDRDTAKKEKANKRNLEVRDSLLKRNYDSSLVEIKKKFDTTNIKTIEMLVKYGYKADSANNRLVKIVRDSSKTKIMIADDPVVRLCETNGIEFIDYSADTFHYKLSFCSRDASSSNFNIDFHVILADSSLNNFLYYQKFNFIPKDTQMSKDTRLGYEIDVFNKYPFIDVCLLVQGTYKNFDASKSYPINEVYYYNISKKRFGQLINPTKSKIIDFAKKNSSVWNNVLVRPFPVKKKDS